MYNISCQKYLYTYDVSKQNTEYNENNNLKFKIKTQIGVFIVK